MSQTGKYQSGPLQKRRHFFRYAIIRSDMTNLATKCIAQFFLRKSEVWLYFEDAKSTANVAVCMQR